MPEKQNSHRTFRFGLFELDEATGELRKDGNPQPRLRGQTLRILLMLLERPRDLVTRDEIRELLWSSDTFVDFDHGVNTAINQLRAALDDDAASPRFIQTLPRRGYRFVAPVELDVASMKRSFSIGADPRPASESPAPAQAADPQIATPRTRLLSDPRDLPSASNRTVRALFTSIQLIYLTFYVLALARLPEVKLVLKAAEESVRLLLIVVIITAAAGIPVRLYLITATAFNYRALAVKFRKLFPVLFLLDELWALAPFLAGQQLGLGLALAVTAALLYLPFAQRSLLLMGEKHRRPVDASGSGVES